MARTVVRAAVFAVTAALLGAAGAGAPARASDAFEDIPVISRAVNAALEFERTGVAVRWSNPRTGNGGTITVMQTYYRPDGTPCRDYERTTEGAAGPATVVGTGCRTRPAAWELDEKPKPAAADEAAAPAPPEPPAAMPAPRPADPPAPPDPTPDPPAAADEPDVAAVGPPIETAPEKDPVEEAAIPPPPRPAEPPVIEARVPTPSDE